MKTIYKVYRDRLVEITGKSRSLYSKNLSARQSYNLGKLFDVNPQEAEEFRNFLWNNTNLRQYRMLTDEQITPFLKELKLDKLTAAQKNKYLESEQKSFVQLKREIEEIQRDTGRYELFVGYPFIEGMINKNIAVKGPLLLFPARISTEKDIDLILLKDEPVQLNKVFLLSYSREMHLNIDNLIMEFENFPERFTSITDVINYLNEHGIKLKYNAGKKLITNIETAKENEDDLEVRHHCVLGRYPLANSIYYDYNELFRKKLSSPTLEALLNNTMPKIKEKKSADLYYTAHSLDYAQEMAIEKCDKQKHMVIYGPPGTGKSQTIASMIVDNICKERSALVVSQKRSALDVVFNRLGPINAKAVILPDPEKNKIDFYNKAKARYAQIQEYKPQYDDLSFRNCCTQLEAEVAELRTISDVFFTDTGFGLSLQSMYTMSSNIGKNSADYALYTAMQKTGIIKMNYRELTDVCASITQRNKGKLFYDHITLAGSNPLVDYIKTDIDVHTLNLVKTFLRKLITKERVPFNVAGYSYSRYMLVYNLEQHDSKNIKPLVDMIAKSENPTLHNALKLTYFPLFWPGFPFIMFKYNKKRKEIENKLLTAENAVKHFVNEFTLLKSVLESAGLAMVIDSIAYGNDKFIKKLLAALDEYVTIRTVKLAVDSITETERMVINYAVENSKNQTEFFAILDKIIPIRIYHEVIENEKRKEQILSKTIIYEDLRKRIIELKNQQKHMSSLLAQDNFNEKCKQMFEQEPEKTKNFLHQINKQRGHWPVRRLLEHFETFLLQMFPCWLLSPESASSVLPLKEGLFDVVLFDEASQLFIESTIPAVYRGKSLVVSGDDKQLKPTSVFIKRYMGDDTYDSDTSLNTQALMEVESLLDLASSRLNATNLTYHYRSEHEELINFSNYAFYGGNLQIAPNISKNSDYLPIERIKVDGRWIGRHNHEEAQAIVKLIKHIFKNRKNRETIGIVTFNTEQEEYIKDLFDKECLISPQFKNDYLKELSRIEKGEDNSIFVKNLENVQGDERDIIIFSIGYARNEDGKLGAQFGTLSMSGGENRLNVAITRAIKKIYVVTSVEPEEFTNISSTKNDGPKLLIKYLQYTRALSERKYADVKNILESLIITPKIRNNSLGEFEKTIKKEIEKLGYSVEVNLGNSDYKISLAVYDEGLDRYLLGIECDYSAFNSSTSMMERDVYRIDFLQSRGWDIMRLWSRDWWIGKSNLIKQIENRINYNRKTYIEQHEIDAPMKKNKPKIIASSETEVIAVPIGDTTKQQIPTISAQEIIVQSEPVTPIKTKSPTKSNQSPKKSPSSSKSTMTKQVTKKPATDKQQKLKDILESQKIENTTMMEIAADSYKKS